MSTHRSHSARSPRMRWGWLALALAAVLPAAHTPSAQADEAEARPAGIVWYATIESGIKEAKRANKPILLMSAAPHCRNISGMW